MDFIHRILLVLCLMTASIGNTCAGSETAVCGSALGKCVTPFMSLPLNQMANIQFICPKLVALIDCLMGGVKSCPSYYQSLIEINKESLLSLRTSLKNVCDGNKGTTISDSSDDSDSKCGNSVLACMHSMITLSPNQMIGVDSACPKVVQMVKCMKEVTPNCSSFDRSLIQLHMDNMDSVKNECIKDMDNSGPGITETSACSFNNILSCFAPVLGLSLSQVTNLQFLCPKLVSALDCMQDGILKCPAFLQSIYSRPMEVFRILSYMGCPGNTAGNSGNLENTKCPEGIFDCMTRSSFLTKPLTYWFQQEISESHCLELATFNDCSQGETQKCSKFNQSIFHLPMSLFKVLGGVCNGNSGDSGSEPEFLDKPSCRKDHCGTHLLGLSVNELSNVQFSCPKIVAAFDCLYGGKPECPHHNQTIPRTLFQSLVDMCSGDLDDIGPVDETQCTTEEIKKCEASILNLTPSQRLDKEDVCPKLELAIDCYNQKMKTCPAKHEAEIQSALQKVTQAKVVCPDSDNKTHVDETQCTTEEIKKCEASILNLTPSQRLDKEDVCPKLELAIDCYNQKMKTCPAKHEAEIQSALQKVTQAKVVCPDSDNKTPCLKPTILAFTVVSVPTIIFRHFL